LAVDAYQCPAALEGVSAVVVDVDDISRSLDIGRKLGDHVWLQWEKRNTATMTTKMIATAATSASTIFLETADSRSILFHPKNFMRLSCEAPLPFRRDHNRYLNLISLVSISNYPKNRMNHAIMGEETQFLVVRWREGRLLDRSTLKSRLTPEFRARSTRERGR